MGTIAQKLTYLNNTKEDLKEIINYTGANIGTNDTFRSYVSKLKQGYLDILNNGIDTLYNNFPKVSGIGSNLSLTPTYKAPIKLNEIQGDTLQENTPTPDTPVEIQSVTGLQNINVCGKNLFDMSTAVQSSYGYHNNTGTLTHIDNNTIKIVKGNTSTDARMSVANNINISSGTTISVSWEYGTGNGNVVGQIQAVNNSGSVINLTSLNNNGLSSPQILTLTDDIKYIYLGTAWNNHSDLVIKNIQIEVGSATEYEPYKGNTYEVNLGKNYFNSDVIIPNMISSVSTQTPFSYNSSTKELTITNSSNDTYLPALWANANYKSGINIDVEKNTIYTFHFTASQPDSTLKNAVFGLNKSTNKYEYIEVLSQKSSFTFNTGNYDVITFRLGSTATTGTVTIFSNFQLEKGNATSYSPYFTPIELNKIGDYEDYIFKNEPNNPLYDDTLTLNSWYITKNIGKVVLNGSETWTRLGTSTTPYKYYTNKSEFVGLPTTTVALSTHYAYDGVKSSSELYRVFYFNMSSGQTTSNGNLTFTTPDITSVNDFKDWLSSNNIKVLYQLSTPIYEVITNEELINQLETLYNAKSEDGTTNINVTSEDLSMILNVSVLKGE